MQDAWEYLAVCLPVVVFFAPLGSFIASYFHRLTLAVLIYILETVALVGEFQIFNPLVCSFFSNAFVLSRDILEAMLKSFAEIGNDSTIYCFYFWVDSYHLRRGLLRNLCVTL